MWRCRQAHYTRSRGGCSDKGSMAVSQGFMTQAQRWIASVTNDDQHHVQNMKEDSEHKTCSHAASEGEDAADALSSNSLRRSGSVTDRTCGEAEVRRRMSSLQPVRVASEKIAASHVRVNGMNPITQARRRDCDNDTRKEKRTLHNTRQEPDS
eukprot:368280-Rhodomonas_salina.1